jgi:hypothetical protein
MTASNRRAVPVRRGVEVQRQEQAAGGLSAQQVGRRDAHAAPAQDRHGARQGRRPHL